MKFMRATTILSFALGLLLIAGASSFTSAQGRGGGRPSNPGPPVGNPGIGRGIGTASTSSGGRSDSGLGTASSNSNGRSDAGIARAGNGAGNRNIPDNNELNRYNGISRKLGVSTETLRSRYEVALLTNPKLTFGQFVAANVIANNVHSQNRSITTSAILGGLQNGDSIGKTLKNLGISGDEADRIKEEADREIKESKKKN